ncbi:MAG TPA: hypothetical protein PLU43_01110, partial [Lachnospiraceae bacterium]|nr:hypothetical protein [Lachnospiraceae bacterium]
MDNERKRVYLFLAITFVLTYAIEIGILWPLVGNKSAATTVTEQGIKASMMFIPALSVVITRLITKEGFKNHYMKWTWNRETTKYYIFAWIGPAVLVLCGALLYFLIFPQRFDINMSYLVSVYKENGTAVAAADLRKTIISQIAAAVLIAPLLNCVTCFGEEWGWRGYLLPKLAKKFSLIPL